ncbi:MAG TPA: hypothetical protein VLY63_09710 [Anaerolineae bacterium]|nr:hypothetical protein [Anaerolineae bacterium]
MPGKRASYTRFEVLRTVLISLGALALILFAIAEFLAMQPLPTAPLGLPTVRVTRPTATADPSALALLTNQPTRTSAPTDTATAIPSPTRTLVPTVTRRPKPTPTVPTATPTPISAPTLLEPVQGETVLDKTIFRWQWDGRPLAENMAFDLRIWSTQEEQAGGPKRGAVSPTNDTAVEVELPFVPAVQDYGPGEYYWTVVVVELISGAPAKQISNWGERRGFVYR